MFSIIRKLSGESQEEQRSESVSSDANESKKNKHYHSGDMTYSEGSNDTSQKKSKLSRSNAQVSEDNNARPSTEETELTKSPQLPEGTPDWGIKLVEIIQGEFRAVTNHVKSLELQSERNKNDIQGVERKLVRVEEENKMLHQENNDLKERLLDLECKQEQCNLIFEDVQDTANESDVEAKTMPLRYLGPGLLRLCHRSVFSA